MLEFEKKHKRGIRTFIYTLVTENWLMILIGFGLIYLSWTMYFGNLRPPMERFLTENNYWYITADMLSQWILLLGISLLLIAYLRGHIYHSYYKFMLDEYAVHLHKGLFFIQETTIPYTQISNVHIMRPYHYRIAGVAQFDIVTAADKSAEAMEVRAKKFFIPVIDTKIARILSRQLLQCAERSRKGIHVYGENEPILDDSEENQEEEEGDDGVLIVEE